MNYRTRLMAAGILFFSLGCGGKIFDDSEGGIAAGGDSSGDASGSGSGGGSSSGVGSSSGGGSGGGSGSSSGGSGAGSGSGSGGSSSSSGSSGGGTACGAATCTAAQVCCVNPGGGGGAMQACVAKGQCMGVMLSCTSAASCQAGNVCCFTLGGGAPSAACQRTCAGGSFQLCSMNAECTQGQTCQASQFGQKYFQAAGGRDAGPG